MVSLFYKKRLGKMVECEDFNLDDIKIFSILIIIMEICRKIKVKIQLPNDEIVYHFSLVKNPDIRAKAGG